ncbi:hypothetical protein AVDCRST_MAG81-178 [uncultured Synechococcales cyanobacterium]|uniref:Uncharacterized protein n=1 Tax=uncultured Synechococcales cyanobacterium TaxID=1936017 RepID=A0A6J4UQL3_9CYAN|nr:hypothetical protein AVDCRST_MAG81-178 [uncultured Synechococcales cyanobacterium]
MVAGLQEIQASRDQQHFCAARFSYLVARWTLQLLAIA